MMKSPNQTGECPSLVEESPSLTYGTQPSADAMRLAKKAAARAEHLRVHPPTDHEIKGWALTIAGIMVAQDELDQESARVLYENLWDLYE